MTLRSMEMAGGKLAGGTGRTPASATIRRFVDPDEPWIWLIYLPLYGLPWVFAPVPTFDLIASAVAIAAFLVLYIGGARTRGRWLIGCAVAVFVLSLLLAPLSGNWTILTIYAAAMVGKLRPSKQALGIIAMFCAAASGVGMLSGEIWSWWLPGVLLAAMIGGANVSRTALLDKNVALIAAHEEVRNLSSVAERERITRDLHDVLGSTLTLIAVKADLAERLLGKDAGSAQREIGEIGACAREGLGGVRKAIAGIANIGLARELEASCEVLETAAIACIVEGDPETVPVDQRAILAMTLREAVTNVVRHARASSCRIGIVHAPGLVALRIADDGCGGSFREGSGLSGMRTRLIAAGGSLTVASNARGTSLTASLPVLVK